MYSAHTSALPFKDNRLRSQVPTCASTLARTSDQFHFSWRPGLNHTLRMRTSPSLQRKSPGRRMRLFHAPNRRPSLLSKLILALATSSYLSTAFFTASMFKWQDTKTVISSAHAETFALTLPVKETSHMAGLAFSSLSLQSRGSKTRT